MAKARSVYVCQQCGHVAQSWMGRCPSCSEWNTLVEQASAPKGAAARPAAAPSRAIPLTRVALEEGGEVRLRIGIAELDRVLGGGLVTGALTLLGGDPGVGKSTLLLMAMHHFARRGIRVLYVSGEESARQVRLRAERLGAVSDALYLLADTGIEAAIAAVDEVQPKILVLDSVQTLHSAELDGVPGSISQVRDVAARAMQVAKGKDVATFLVGHVTKEGSIAGPRMLEHLVDTVLYFEGDGSTELRVLRATKNRFGSTGEIGMFEMREEGLAEVPDASARLLAERAVGAAGTAVTCTMEGSRPLLVEVQALVGRPTPATPTRNTIGLDRGRLAMLLAVLAKIGLDFSDRDVFVSVAGGVRVQEPAADLAVCAALASSASGVPVPATRLFFGEVGLVGELRGVSAPLLRLKEAERHGFRDAVAPMPRGHEGTGLPVRAARTLREAIGG